MVTQINETLRNNRLRGVNVMEGSVLVAGLKRCATACVRLYTLHCSVCVHVCVCVGVCLSVHEYHAQIFIIHL